MKKVKRLLITYRAKRNRERRQKKQYSKCSETWSTGLNRNWRLRRKREKAAKRLCYHS